MLPFHFVESARPELTVAEGFSVIRERPQDEVGVEIFISAPDGDWHDETSWVSRAYRHRSEARVPTLRFRSEKTTQIVSFIIPRRAQDLNITVRALITDEGKAFEIVDGSRRDLVLLGPTRIENENIVSDYKLAWLRFDTASKPDRAVLLHGQQLVLNGTDVNRLLN